MSGIGHYTDALARALLLCRTTESLTLIGNSRTLTPLLSEFNDDRILTPRPSAEFWEQLELPELLTAEGAGLYHNPAFGLPLIKPCRYVATVHDCIPRIFPELAPPWLSDFFHHRALAWFEQADHLSCASAHTAHDVMHLYGIPAEKMSVVYQTADAAFRPLPEERVLNVRKRYGLDRPYILVVGRVERRKNVAGILRAFELLRDTDLEPHLLVLAGPRGDHPEDAEGLPPSEGRQGQTVVTGYVSNEDLAALYCGATVFCFPSFYEGFGRPVLEAMSCGAPVVASRTSSVPEVGGDACLYVDPYDAEDIAAAIYQVASSEELRSALIARGLRRAAEFTLERMGKETLRIYHQVLGTAAP